MVVVEVLVFEVVCMLVNMFSDVFLNVSIGVVDFVLVLMMLWMVEVFIDVCEGKIC